MGELLIRRREMILPSSTPVITPAYELASPTSASEYDTGWIPFPDTPKDFTILCEATFSNRNWDFYSTKVIFGIGTGATLRVGNANDYNYYANGAKTGSNKQPYTGLIFNNYYQDSDTKKCCSLYARDSGTTATTKRFAVRFTHSTCLCEGFCARGSSYYAPNSNWWNLSAVPTYPTAPIKFNWNVTTTINRFIAYDTLLTDSQINDFLTGGA